MFNRDINTALPVQINVTSEYGVAASLEAKRLSEKYGKDYFCCEDLTKILGVGMNNIRQLMCRSNFPTIEVGNRKVVSSMALALWSLTHQQEF